MVEEEVASQEAELQHKIASQDLVSPQLTTSVDKIGEAEDGEALLVAVATEVVQHQEEEVVQLAPPEVLLPLIQNLKAGVFAVALLGTAPRTVSSFLSGKLVVRAEAVVSCTLILIVQTKEILLFSRRHE